MYITAIHRPWRKHRGGICRYKTFWMQIFERIQPSCCLDVVAYMVNCVFWRHIPLEIEFKRRENWKNVFLISTHVDITVYQHG